jgi:hypothetical protein
MNFLGSEGNVGGSGMRPSNLEFLLAILKHVQSNKIDLAKEGTAKRYENGNSYHEEMLLSQVSIIVYVFCSRMDGEETSE